VRFLARPWLAPLVLVLAAVGVHANGLTGAFIWDDRSLVVDNARVHGLSHLPELLGLGDARFGFRMVRDLSYALDYSIGGLDPVVYHVSNVLWHGLVVWLVWLLALRLGIGRTGAFWAGLVFAVHPVHVDAVTYISGRRDVLSTALYLGSVLAFARFRAAGDGGGRGGGAWLALAAALGALGISAKEMAATFPAAWFLYDACVLGRGRGGGIVTGAREAVTRHWRLYGGGLLLAGAFIAYVVIGQRSTLGEGPMGGSWGIHALTEAVILAYGVRLLLFPAGLLIDYQHFFPPVASLAEPRLWFALAVLGGSIALSVYAFRRRPAPAFAAHWLWVTYLPVMQIIPHPEHFAEHYLYLPSVGAALLFGMGIAALAARPGLRLGAVSLAGAAALLLAAGTWHRNRDFRSEITIFEAALKVHARAPRVWNNLALAYEEAGDRERGIRLLTGAMGVTRDPLLTANLANMLGHDGRWREALPWLLDAYARYPGDPRILRELGQAFYHAGRLPDARRAFTELLAVRPGSPDAHLGLGNTARRMGDMAGAVRHYEQVVRRDPERLAAWTGLGIAREGMGNAAGAREAFERVLALAPEDGNAWNNLGVLFLLESDLEAAEERFARAVEVPEVPPAAWLNLARVRIKLGRCNGAVAALDAARAAHAPLAPGPVAATRARAALCARPDGP
jgi:tetratricopeptide (TPR) repeat protein